MAFLTTIRLENACRRLQATNDTLAAIAGACGFCSEYHLSRVFKQHFGLSPREYRLQHAVRHAAHPRRRR